jgi:hypothetical protein
VGYVDPKKRRKFQRYDVSHSLELGGSIPEASSLLRLATIGLGGCGFFSEDVDPGLVPPKEIVCSFFATGEAGYERSEYVVGNIVYMRPANFSTGSAFHYGIKFHQEEINKIQPFIKGLEKLAEKGELPRA